MIGEVILLQNNENFAKIIARKYRFYRVSSPTYYLIDTISSPIYIKRKISGKVHFIFRIIELFWGNFTGILIFPYNLLVFSGCYYEGGGRRSLPREWLPR